MGILIRTLKPLYQATSPFSTACHSRTAQKMSKLEALIADRAAYPGEKSAAQARLKEMRARCSKVQCGDCPNKSSDKPVHRSDSRFSESAHERVHRSDSRFNESAFKAGWSVFQLVTLGTVLLSLKTIWNAARDKVEAEAAVDGIAVLKNGGVFARYNKSVVLSAVSQNGLALEFAAPYLRNTPDVVLKAVKQNRNAIEFASPNLLYDRECVMNLLKAEAHTFYWVTKHREAQDKQQPCNIEPIFEY